MKIKVSDILRYVLLAFLAVVWLVPIVWLLATSFSKYTGMNTSTFFPKEWAIDSYKNLLFGSDTVAQFPQWFWNTFIIACFTCIISTAFVLMVAYAHILYEVQRKKNVDEHCRCHQPVPGGSGDDRRVLYFKEHRPDEQPPRTDLRLLGVIGPWLSDRERVP